MPQPQPNPTVIQQPKGEGGNKMVLWLVLGILIVGLIGGAYWYMSSQKSYTNENTREATPTSSPESDLTGELDSIDVQSSNEAELNALDADLQSL